MIKIPKEVIFDKIKEKTGMSDSELKTRIKDKLDLLSGLISEEGAAHIIANELGVKIFDESAKLQIKNVLAGMRNIEITAKVMKIYEVREFNKEGKSGKVGNFLIGDQTGVMRVVAWNDKADLLSKIKENDIIRIEHGYAKENNNRMEIHLGDKTIVTISPQGAGDIDVKSMQTAERKKIKDLAGGEENVELLGTIVQVFDPRFFETCPQCGKRAKARDDAFYKVTPEFSYVLNLMLDDGSENVRVVLWKSQVQRLLNMPHDAILAKREAGFEDTKNDLLGKIVKFVGRATKNQMFERIEFVPQLVFTDPNPDEEFERINTQIKEAEKKEEDASEEKPIPMDGGDIVEEIKIGKDTKPKKDEFDTLDEIEDLTDLDSL